MGENNRKFRVTVLSALVFEVCLIFISVVIGYSIFPRWQDIWLAPTMLIIYLSICTLPLAYFKGLEFSLHDVEDGFPWVHYHFVSIFVAAAVAPLFNSAIITVIGELKLG